MSRFELHIDNVVKCISWVCMMTERLYDEIKSGDKQYTIFAEINKFAEYVKINTEYSFKTPTKISFCPKSDKYLFQYIKIVEEILKFNVLLNDCVGSDIAEEEYRKLTQFICVFVKNFMDTYKYVYFVLQKMQIATSKTPSTESTGTLNILEFPTHSLEMIPLDVLNEFKTTHTIMYTIINDLTQNDINTQFLEEWYIVVHGSSS